MGLWNGWQATRASPPCLTNSLPKWVKTWCNALENLEKGTWIKWLKRRGWDMFQTHQNLQCSAQPYVSWNLHFTSQGLNQVELTFLSFLVSCVTQDSLSTILAESQASVTFKSSLTQVLTIETLPLWNWGRVECVDQESNGFIKQHSFHIWYSMITLKYIKFISTTPK